MKKSQKSIFVILNLVITTVLSNPTDEGFTFNYSNIGIRDITSQYGAHLPNAGVDFSNAGNLVFYSAPANLNPPYSGHIAFYESDFGVTTWDALAVPYNNLNQTCYVNGQVDSSRCNSNQGAEYGVIYFNTHGKNLPFPIDVINYQIRHEFSHILGLGHSFVCNQPVSVMVFSPACFPRQTVLQSLDINLIGNKYP